MPVLPRPIAFCLTAVLAVALVSGCGGTFLLDTDEAGNIRGRGDHDITGSGGTGGSGGSAGGDTHQTGDTGPGDSLFSGDQYRPPGDYQGGDENTPGDGFTGDTMAGDTACVTCGSDCCEIWEECISNVCLPKCNTDRCGLTLSCCPSNRPECVYNRFCQAPCPNPADERCDSRGDICCDSTNQQTCGASLTCVRDCPVDQALCGDGTPTQLATPGSFGTVCCAVGDVCVFDACIPVTDPCQSFVDCDIGEYCELTLDPPGCAPDCAQWGQCLPNEFPPDVPICQGPATDIFDPTFEWHWLGVGLDASQPGGWVPCADCAWACPSPACDGLCFDGTSCVACAGCPNCVVCDTCVDFTDNINNVGCFKNVSITPVTADMDLDGTPEVIFKAYRGNRPTDLQPVVVVDGATGQTLHVMYSSDECGQVAVGNIDYDPELEIVDVRDQLTQAYDPYDLAAANPLLPKWSNGDGNLAMRQWGVAPTLTDFDADGQTEILVVGVVLDGETGIVLADFGSENRSSGNPGGINGPRWSISVVADVDLDGEPEAVVGNSAIQIAPDTATICPSLGCTATQHCEERTLGNRACYANNPAGDPDARTLSWSWRVDWRSTDIGAGYTGVGNFVDNTQDPYNPGGGPGDPALGTDQDYPEVTVVIGGDIAILNGKTGAAMTAIDGTTMLDFSIFTALGGPPNIADFDGDGRVEVSYAATGCMVVVDVDCAVGHADIRAGVPNCTTNPGHPVCAVCAADPTDAYCLQCLDADLTVEPTCRELPAGCDYSPADPALDNCTLQVVNGPPINDLIGVLWMDETQDASSAMTGTSVFDFQGDGRAEVLYADECFFRVYNGPDGEVLMERPNSSRTTIEYPTVVDVDGDGNSEIVIPANNDVTSVANARSCHSTTANDTNAAYWNDQDLYTVAGFCDLPDDPASPIDPYDICRTGVWGVYVLGDAQDRWVKTLPYWHQHAFHVTEVTEDGQPIADWGPNPDNWDIYNNYRQNVQGFAPLNAPDLVVFTFIEDHSNCPPSVRLNARIVNRGRAGIQAGAPIDFYQLDDCGSAISTLIETVPLPVPLLPGQGADVETIFVVPISELLDNHHFAVDANPDNSTPFTPTYECNPDNNQASLCDVNCEIGG